jgi:hypothetical protein
MLSQSRVRLDQDCGQFEGKKKQVESISSSQFHWLQITESQYRGVCHGGEAATTATRVQRPGIHLFGILFTEPARRHQPKYMARQLI